MMEKESKSREEIEDKVMQSLIHKKTQKLELKHSEKNTAWQDKVLLSIWEKMKGLKVDITLKVFTMTSTVVRKTWQISK